VHSLIICQYIFSASTFLFSAYAGHLGTDNKKVEQQPSIDDLPLFEGQIPATQQEETSSNQNEDDSLTELPLRSPSKVLIIGSQHSGG
jgi:hypothetical protein